MMLYFLLLSNAPNRSGCAKKVFTVSPDLVWLLGRSLICIVGRDEIASMISQSLQILTLTQKVNSVHSFGLELTVMSPPSLRQSILQIFKPRPLPFGFIFLVSLSLLNGLKSLLWSSSDIPVPLFATVTTSWTFCPSFRREAEILMTPPVLVTNFVAFDVRFKSTYCIRSTSPMRSF